MGHVKPMEAPCILLAAEAIAVALIQFITQIMFIQHKRKFIIMDHGTGLLIQDVAQQQ